jgi:hypothetical protein
VTVTNPPEPKTKATPTPSPTATPTPTPKPLVIGTLLPKTSGTPKPMPPRPAALQKLNSPTQPATTGGRQATAKSGGGGSGGGGSGGGGSGGGGSEGGSTGTETPTTDTNSPTTTASSNEYWLQTDEDPAGTTPINSRHNKGCIKYKNVTGKAATKDEGIPCPLCGG